MLNDLSAYATLAGIVNNILKLTQTFGNISQSLQSVNKLNNSKGFSSGFPKFTLCTNGKCCISVAKSSSLRSVGYWCANPLAFF